MNLWASKQKAFTIVELLIVIVVIAILAAITIVAYNGIQDRARASAAQAAAKQASTKIQAYLVENAENYPASPAAAGLSTTSGTTYEYRYDNAANPRTFCLTATTNNVSYYVSNTTTTPTAGACDGHGVNGVAAITNLARNPSAESNISGWGVANWQGGGGTTTREASVAAVGAASYRMTWQTASTAANAGFLTPYAPTVPGNTYNFSVYVRSPVTTSVNIVVRQATNSDGTGSIIDQSLGTATVTANSWSRVSGVATIASGYNSAALRIGFLTHIPSAGQTFGGDGFMAIEGNGILTYADGNSSGWIWNGTPNDSTSSGPPL